MLESTTLPGLWNFQLGEVYVVKPPLQTAGVMSVRVDCFFSQATHKRHHRRGGRRRTRATGRNAFSSIGQVRSILIFFCLSLPKGFLVMEYIRVGLSEVMS